MITMTARKGKALQGEGGAQGESWQRLGFPRLRAKHAQHTRRGNDDAEEIKVVGKVLVNHNV